MCESVAEIREGGGPRLIEFSTYRWLEHCGPFYDNHIGYRSEAEFCEWQAKEPIARFERVMLDNSTITAAELQLMNENIALEVEDAFAFAEASPMPVVDSAYSGLYSEQPSLSSALER